MTGLTGGAAARYGAAGAGVDKGLDVSDVEAALADEVAAVVADVTP